MIVKFRRKLKKTVVDTVLRAMAIAFLVSTAAANERVLVQGQTALMTALAAADGGETILLKGGDYGRVILEDLSFESPVTITTVDAEPMVSLSHLAIFRSRNLRFEGLLIDSGSREGRAIVHIEDSDAITVANSTIHGLVGTSYPITGPAFGIYVYGKSANIVISGNHIHDLANGVALFGTAQFEVTENRVDRIGQDAFKFSAVQDGLVARNIGPTHFYPTDDAHVDFMQFQGPASRGVTITGNVFLPQNRFDAQGIFVAGQGGHRDFDISQNIIYTKMANGIRVNGAGGIVIRNNTLINALDEGRPRTSIVVGDTPGAIVEGNITSGRRGKDDGSNITMQHTNPDGALYYGDLFQNIVGRQGLLPSDLAPVPGSPAERLGAHQRLTELMVDD